MLALLALIPASDAAVVLVNRIITNQFAPKALPGLALRDGVPRSLRTLVVVPTLLTTRAEIEEQIERLEVHHLAGSATATSATRCSRTGRTPTPSTRPATTRCSRRRARESPA